MHINSYIRLYYVNEFIKKTCLYNFDPPPKPHFYTVKLGFTWVYFIFLFSAQKHRLWYLLEFLSKNFHFFFGGKISSIFKQAFFYVMFRFVDLIDG